MKTPLVTVIGAGASGLSAAVAAASAGTCRVLLLERNDRPGKKLLITGNGRCNLGNSRLDPDRYEGETALARSVLGRFGISETLAFLKETGIGIYDRDGYLYPASREASDVRRLLELRVRELGVSLKTGFQASVLEKRGDGFRIVSAGGEEIRSDRVILAGGGTAAPKTGSDGSALSLAVGLGHGPEPFRPALVPLTVSGNEWKEAAGVRVIAEVKLCSGGRILGNEHGEIQFGEKTLSGIPVLDLSARAGKAFAEREDVRLILCFTDSPAAEAMVQLRSRASGHPGWESGDLLSGMLPHKLIPILLKKAGIPLHVPAARIQSPSLARLSDLLAATEIPVSGTGGVEQAQTTAGGIRAEELSPDLRSLLCPGLYFAGEIVNVHGPCGGYNLQWAWSSGAVAGSAAAASLRSF